MNAAEIEQDRVAMAPRKSIAIAAYWFLGSFAALFAATTAWSEPRMFPYVAGIFWCVFASTREVRRLLSRLRDLGGSIANQPEFVDTASPDRVLRGARFWAHGLIASGTAIAMLLTTSMVLSIARTTSSDVAGRVWLRVFGVRVWLVSTGFLSQLSSTSLAICAVAVLAGAAIVVLGRQKNIDRASIGLLVWVAGSGLILWLSHRCFGGVGYYGLSLFHTASVATLLLAIPSSRLSHILVRPIMLSQMRLISRTQGEAKMTENASIMASCAVTITPKDRRIRFAEAQEKLRNNRWLTRR